MQVILSKNVSHLGRAGEEKKVASGFARNFLLPRGLAVPATEGVRRSFSKRQAKLQETFKKQEKEALGLKEKFEDVKLQFHVLVDEKGALYGSVGKSQIIKSLKEKGLSLPRAASIVLKEPLKLLGDFDVPVDFHSGVQANLRVTLTRSDAS